ncbi:hypothetical protein ASE74_22535 [Pedobacter sp. Leaf216]|uniref:5-oxoprolinase subunit PxpB n=1 Tax=Pedobacter sp. Leaf216 TaxID=1735684 RepID=UPI000700FB62|nr:5-oxoprolinase subunit PxpB [Pedobacter sp. Leaf216]KQM72654.1 hypothetical protein ASE74_22535 [Pedobacter sp. Leaf216]
MTEESPYFTPDYSVNIYGLNEQSVTVEFGTVISEEILQLITSYNRVLMQNPFPGLITTVPAYCTLTVFFDPLLVHTSNLPGETCFDKVSYFLNHIKQSESRQAINKPVEIIIPVCYGGSFGADIETVAKINQLSIAEVIERHSSMQYIVYMIGFVPGFAYMGGMDASLQTPRKQVPDATIPAGSVGIAGMQTGIYPIETPGGWQIIGRTPLKMFDVNRAEPSLLKGGNLVRFRAINIDEFNTYGKQ